jgi:hypothetical protein
LASAVCFHFMSVGASSGIFGLLGVCVADCWSNWDLITLADDEFPVVQCLVWLVVDTITTLCPEVVPYLDNLYHCVGFFYGIFIGVPLIQRLSQTGKTPRARRIGTMCWKWWALVVATALFVTTFGILYASDPETGPPDVCPYCKHISCVPFPFWQEDKWWECDGCESVTVQVFRLQTVTCPSSCAARTGMPRLWTFYPRQLRIRMRFEPVSSATAETIATFEQKRRRIKCI